MPINDEQLTRFANTGIFVETGIDSGQTLRRILQLPLQPRYIGVECFSTKAENARKIIREESAEARAIVLEGDSADLISEVVEKVNASGLRATFWLDAHHKEAKTPFPLRHELGIMLTRLERRDHTILIDDVRSFSKYEVSVPWLRERLKKFQPNYRVTVLPWQFGKFQAPRGFLAAFLLDADISS